MLRSKLNRAGKATDVKLAASKTAPGLHFESTFSEKLPTDNSNYVAYFSARCEEHVTKI
jgi:hypothetical protein